jgi:hypothetical protein
LIGPSIYGHSDAKEAIACLLLGESKKVCILVKKLICFRKKVILFALTVLEYCTSNNSYSSRFQMGGR